ncbi:MAG: RecX family transcriptional regulator [Alphaproteobacteria bacterium]|nr:RecX family transcriptional regulator [Alphaproteobacteria bacterium]
MAQDNPQTAKVKPERRAGKRVPKKITESYLHNSGLYYLQRFAASTSRFRSVMLRKVKKSCHAHPEQDYEACAQLVEALVLKFEAAGLLNDELYTNGAVASMRRRGLSQKAVLAKMAQRGIGANNALLALQAYDAEESYGDETRDSEFQAALMFARRKKIGPFRNMSVAEDEKTQQKALSALARAGFSYDVSRRVLEAQTDDFIL